MYLIRQGTVRIKWGFESTCGEPAVPNPASEKN